MFYYEFLPIFKVALTAKVLFVVKKPENIV